ncbi:MAG: triple tyrosine motif-containing protein [Ignavibacteria bacterium]|nr:triple tyrosine motif-containing protein [Ignavibacteria bacterium]
MKRIKKYFSCLNSLKNKFSIFALLFIIQAAAVCQSDNQQFIHLSLERGIALNLTYTMIQDHEGYIWFGTMYGLVRYDGKNYRTYKYDSENPESISFDDVISLYEDSKDNLWIGTWGGGLNMLDPQRNKFRRFVHDPSNPEGISDNIIWSITEDSNGNIWLGTAAGGINKYDPIQNKFFSYNLESSNDSSVAITILTLYTDTGGTVWAGSMLGISKYSKSDDDFITYSFSGDKNFSKYNSVLSIYEVSQNVLLVGTRYGLFRFNKNTTEYHFVDILPKARIKSITIDHKDIVWLATNKGLIKFKSTDNSYFTFTHTDDPRSISGNLINTVFEDRSGVIWVISYNSGVSKLINHKSKFTLLQNKTDDKKSLSSSWINCLAEDSYGNIWTGTKGGLNMFDPKTKTIERINHPQLSNSPISALAIDSMNTIVISLGNNLFGYDKQKNRLGAFLRKKQLKELENKAVNNLKFDSNGNLWIGTYSSGLYKFKDGNLDHISFINEGLPNKAANYILSIYEDNTHRIWIGTYGGLHLYNSEENTFTSFVQELNNPSSISNNYIYSFKDASNGELWIGTARGLNLFNPETKTFNAIFEKDGLPNDVICGIATDKDKHIWVSTLKGISKFDPSVMTFQNFDKDDGLQSNVFGQGVYLQGSDGKIYFGGQHGLNIFDPERMQLKNYNSPIVIASLNLIKSDGQLEKLLFDPNQFELNHNQNSLLVEVISFDYSNPQRIKYRYKLSGYEEKWIDIGNSNNIKLQNLPTGNYSLLVKGTNGDGKWSSSVAQLNFIIQPPFWQTIWFYLTIVAGLLAITISVTKLIIHFKVKKALTIEKVKEEESERIRRKTAIDFHDELGHRLTRISLITELIKRKLGNAFEDISKLLDQIGNNSEQLYDGTKDFIWAIDPKEDSLYDLIIRLKDFGDDLYGNTDLDFEVRGLDEQLQNASLDMDWKRHLTLIFKEGMNNTLKHSNGNKVLLDAHIQGDEVEIILEDNGKGFPQNIEGKGNGIKNMRSRAEKLESSLLIDTRPGKGTKILFKGKFPIKSLIYN